MVALLIIIMAGQAFLPAQEERGFPTAVIIGSLGLVFAILFFYLGYSLIVWVLVLTGHGRKSVDAEYARRVKRKEEVLGAWCNFLVSMGSATPDEHEDFIRGLNDADIGTVEKLIELGMVELLGIQVERKSGIFGRVAVEGLKERAKTTTELGDPEAMGKALASIGAGFREKNERQVSGGTADSGEKEAPAQRPTAGPAAGADEVRAVLQEATAELAKIHRAFWESTEKKTLESTELLKKEMESAESRIGKAGGELDARLQELQTKLEQSATSVGALGNGAGIAFAPPPRLGGGLSCTPCKTEL